ncbi:hypothetical protein K469DRAFT_679395 [Zopfia rhizophila CBS 207.26]|uniref:NADH:flavin oxidoreductase/NADH oxidase N-terminal domain-containing protein n=1 Tax=Zopfia rhizophila CBS 207.26 TaxID=1314779 RepID=A0A6A6DBF3_9PEZI|nr:hypothetical protein K469DRAFT_679395 [Zopfia rhizophila CBS 207.26]
MSKLFAPLKVGRKTLNQRIALVPMTHLRADNHHLPLPSMKEYYGQRASVPGTLLVTEAIVISPQHGVYQNIPGIHNSSQIAAWKEVTRTVHEYCPVLNAVHSARTDIGRTFAENS